MIVKPTRQPILLNKWKKKSQAQILNQASQAENIDQEIELMQQSLVNNHSLNDANWVNQSDRSQRVTSPVRIANADSYPNRVSENSHKNVNGNGYKANQARISCKDVNPSEMEGKQCHSSRTHMQIIHLKNRIKSRKQSVREIEFKNEPRENRNVAMKQNIKPEQRQVKQMYQKIIKQLQEQFNEEKKQRVNLMGIVSLQRAEKLQLAEKISSIQKLFEELVEEYNVFLSTNNELTNYEQNSESSDAKAKIKDSQCQLKDQNREMNKIESYYQRLLADQEKEHVKVTNGLQQQIQRLKKMIQLNQ